MQPSCLTTRTLRHIQPGDARHEGLGRLYGEGIDRRHLQSQACGGEFYRLAGGGQYAVVANAFDAGGQHMQHEAAHKLRALQPDQTFATLVIGAHSIGHRALTDPYKFAPEYRPVEDRQDAGGGSRDGAAGTARGSVALPAIVPGIE